MITSNGWLKFQTPEPGTDLRVWFEPNRCLNIGFSLAASFAAIQIAKDFPDKKLYVALSGGADSEFVLRTFYNMNIEVTPVVVETLMNRVELEYAKRVTRELRIIPHVFKYDEGDMWKYYMENVYVKCRSKSLNCVFGLMAAEIVRDLGGIMINGDHLIGDKGFLESDAFEYFPHMLYKGTSIGFFYYTPELCYSMVKELNEGELMFDYKERVYGTIWRPKFYPEWSHATLSAWRALPQPENGKESYPHGYKHFLDTMEEKVV